LRKYLLLSLLILFFVGCASSIAPKKRRQIEINKQITKEISKDESGSYVKWWDRDDAVPLKIIGVAYRDDEITKKGDYLLLKAILEQFNNESILRGTDIENDIKDRFSSIEVVDFDSSEKYRNRFNASLEYKLSDKDSLIASLRPERNSAELLVSINYNELQRGNLVVEGYKAININGKRNAQFYTLKKENYGNLSEIEKKKALYNSIIALLELSIPSYIALDTDKFAQKSDLRVLSQYDDKKYELSIYKPKYRYNKTKQILYVSPLTDNDLDILYSSHYITFNNDTLTIPQIRELMKVLNRNFLADDEILMASYPDVVMNHSGTSVEYIEKILVTYKKSSYDIDEILSTSVLSQDETMFRKIYFNNNFIEDDIDSGFVFKLADYLAYNPDTHFYDIYIQVKNNRVLKFSESYISSSEALSLLDKNGIESFSYHNGSFANIYNQKIGRCMKFLFYPIEDEVCKSNFYGFCYGVGCLFADTIAIASVLGIGSHAVIYKDSYLDSYRKAVGIRELSLFKSQL